jgi:enterochelin esterase family protein
MSGRLPVIYLLHGGGAHDAEHSWLDAQIGNAGAILGPLIQSGRLPRVAVVTPFVRPLQVPTGAWDFPELNAFHQYLRDLIRTVESDPRLSVRTDRGGRAIAGLSMGGWQAVGVLLRSPEMFSAAANFSGTVQLGFSGNTPSRFDRPLRKDQVPPLAVFYHTCGEQDERFIAANKAFVAELNEAGIPRTYDFLPGRHDWQFWQGALARFAEQLANANWGK